MHCVHCGSALPQGAARCPSCETPVPWSTEKVGTGALTPPDHDTASAETAHSSELAAQLKAALGPNYEVERPIGEGGFAVVYLVKDLTLKRRLAVKVLSPELIASATVLERFRREAETIAQLSHPNIVPIHFIGQSGNFFYLAMAFVEGESLAARIERAAPLPVDDAARIMLEVANALDLAHRRGVIHRDIKPHNVLLEGDSGRALLTDFGIARSVKGGSLTATGMLVGTPAYMSPEQATGEPLDHRVDIYALGIVAYEMLTGKPPFSGDTPIAVLMKRVAETAPSVDTVRPEVPTPLAHVVSRCLASAPDDRFANANDIVKALSGETPVSGIKPAVSVMRPVPRRWRAWLIAAASVAALGGAVALMQLRRTPSPAGPVIPDDMVEIPAGTYQIGRDDGGEYDGPAHQVNLAAFGIGMTEVTVGRYREFVEATGPPTPWQAMPDSMLPVTGVFWGEAANYCAWRYDGGRLPTEEEWEAAARGPEQFRYTWGNAWIPGAANTQSAGQPGPVPVGSYPKGETPLGARDMIGNVWEWTRSQMLPYPGGRAPPAGEQYYVIRGGAFNTPERIPQAQGREAFADASYRGRVLPTTPRANLTATGFRCVLPLAASAGDSANRN